jgi:hypothetical protein
MPMNTETIRLANPRALRAIASCALLVCASTARADAVTEWNAIVEATILTATPDPAMRARTAAIAQVAVFEAVNSIVGDYEPYREKIPAPSGASPQAAAIAAAHRVLVTLHSGMAAELNASRDKSLGEMADGPAKHAGITVGIAAADAILALRADDGFEIPAPYTPGTDPGEYRPTPPENLPAYRPGLGRVATFSIHDGRQVRAPPPPPLGSKKYARDYEEVKRVGEAQSQERPDDRTQVARFYDATDGEQIYYPAARQVAVTRSRTLSENARLFALLGIAMWDSVVACFETKYHFNFWRPVTAIREAGKDGNHKTAPDPDWLADVRRRRARGARGGIRAGRARDHAHQSRRAGDRPDLHLVRADHGRHRRWAHLRRRALSLRSRSRRADGQAGRALHSESRAAPGAASPQRTLEREPI